MSRRSPSTIRLRRHLSGRDRRHDVLHVLTTLIASSGFADLVTTADEYRPPALVGRARVHSTAALCFLEVCAAYFGSARKGHAYLAAGGRWNAYVRHLTRRFPDDPLLEPGATIPSRSTYHAFHRQIAVQAEALATVFTQGACETAQTLGIAPSSGGTLLAPALSNLLIGDGVVLAARSSYAPGTTAWCEAHARIHDRRADPDAAYHTIGGGGKTYGNKFAIWSATSGEPGETVTLAVLPVRKDRNDHEARVAVDALPSLLDHLPGMRGLVYDKALRGGLVDEVWNLGLHPIVPVYDKTGKATEYFPLGSHVFTMPDGAKRQVDVSTHKGEAGFLSVVAGRRHWVGLRAVKITRQPLRGTSPDSVYIHCTVPAHSACDPRWWGATVRVRANPKDLPRGEHLRALPPADPRYDVLYGHRQRAESLNESLKYRLPNRRARSYGQDRQLVDLVFLALVRNTEAVLHWRARTAANAPPVAA